MKRTLILTIQLLVCISFGKSQTVFQKTYGSTGISSGNYVISLPDGYLVAGSTNGYGAGGNDVLVFRTDLDGDLLWTKTYGGSMNDEAFCMEQTQDGNFIIVGTTYSYAGPSLTDVSNIYLIKIDGNGNQIWTRTIGANELDIAYSIKETFDHGFIITGVTGNFFTGPNDLIMAKTDSTGVLEWTRILGSTSNTYEIGRSVIQTRDSAYVAVGYSTAMVAAGDTNMYIVRISPTGAIMNTEHFKVSISSTTNKTYGYNIIQNYDGNLVISGATGGYFQNLFYAYSPFLMITDSSGNFINCKYYNLNSGECRGYSVKQTADGGYLTGGTMGNYFPMMLKVDNTLVTEWCYYYGNFNFPPFISSGNGYFSNISSDGGYIITGYKNEISGTNVHLIKTDDSGLSGCNQGVPSLQGSSSIPTVTSTPGSLLYSLVSNSYQITAASGSPSFPDSTLCGITSIKDITEGQEILIGPNPVVEFSDVQISNLPLGNYIIELFDIEGKLIKKSDGISMHHSLKLSLNDIKKGIYLIRISCNNGKRYNRKLIIY